MNRLSTDLPRKCSVLGIGISVTSAHEVTRLCRVWVEHKRRHKQIRSVDGQRGRYICIVSVHGVMSAVLDRSLGPVFNHADIATPDGMPVVWAMKSFGERRQERVYGPDLMITLCADAEINGHRIYLYGGRSEILSNLRRRLVELFPALRIVGMYSPPFRPLTPDEEVLCVEQISSSGADIVFVGLSTPKQDCWMYRHCEHLPDVIMIGVGAAFDFHAGRVRQAPRWMQRCGLEWSFRLMMEPRRLWRRYLLITPLFLPMWALQKLGVLRYSAAPPASAATFGS